jgi:hypothetical protein
VCFSDVHSGDCYRDGDTALDLCLRFPFDTKAALLLLDDARVVRAVGAIHRDMILDT